MRLENKIALITGSTSGMGQAEAKLFAKEGAKVIVTGRNVERLDKTVAEIKSDGGEAVGIIADITTKEGCEKLYQEAMKVWDRIDILVNNAGIFDGRLPLLETDEDLWRRVYATNIDAPYRLNKLVLPQMIERRAGSIVNVSSVAGLIASKGGAAYTSSKHALVGLTKQMCSEYAEYGIKINAICPGTIVTPLIADIVDTIRNDNIPEHRFGQPEEVAELALFFASDEAKFCNGVIAPIDGGYTVQ